MYKKRLEVCIEDFDPSKSYSTAELEAFADEIIRQDKRENGNVGNILSESQLIRKRNKEVSSDQGVVDGTLTNAQSPDKQRMYWREHPEGRKVSTRAQRKKGAGFYSG